MSTNNKCSGEDKSVSQNTEHNDSVNVEYEEPAASSTRSLCVVSWQVKMPPLEKHRNKLGLGNHLIMSLQKQTFKITIDLEQPTAVALDPGRAARILEDASTLRDEESILLRIWQRGETNESSSGQYGEKGWIEQCRYWLNAVRIEKGNGRVCKVQFGSGRELVWRQVKFSDQEDALRFQTVLQKMTDLERDRGKRQLAKYRRSQGKMSSLDDRDAHIKLLVEVVSISGIAKHVVPYVAMKMGGGVVHRTGYASSDTGSVVYTLTEGCFFLLDMPLLEFFCSTGGMTFLVKDQDSIARKGGIVGRAIVPLDQILNATGERDSYSLFPTLQQLGAKQNDQDTLGKLNIRIRRATPDDIEFMSAYRMASDREGVFSEETFLPIRPPGDTMRLQRKLVPHGETLHRVKPFPDPERPAETKWMTKEQIRQEAKKPSTHWVEAGSGTIGRVYIEVIGCDGLPNMEWRNLNSSPDAFACLVFEDSIVNTDVIANTTSPQWTPWCRRAFAFNVSHPSSNVLLGLFDWDPEKSPVQVAMSFASDVHDPIARIMINVANTVSGTTYTVTYPLYFAKSAEHRQKPRGTITLRVRKEIVDEGKAMLVGMKPPPMTYISVARSNDFAVAHYTTEGDLNEEAFSLNTFTGYIDEIESYQVILDYVKAAALSVLLWRGHYEMKIVGKTLMLPLNSLLAFIWGVLVTNNFNRFPAFLVFSIGWFMLACNEQARQTPNPWEKARRYTPLVKELIFGTTSPADAIAPNEGAAAMAVYKKQLEEKAERLKREKEAEADYERKLREELGHNADDDDDVIVSTKERILDRLSVNPMLLPFKSTLYPIQKELRQRVLQLRIATSIVTWQEQIYAFWITTLSFVITALIFWVPWAFLLKWILRIAVWIVLGPWAAVIARYRFPEHDMTDDDWEEDMRSRLQEKRREAVEASTRIQIRKEDALKRKALSNWMFGQYHLRVPRFTEQLFPDIPMPSSFSEPYNSETAPPVQIKERVYGQYLYGDMIPTREVQVDSSFTYRAKEDVFIKAGLGSYYDGAYGWAEFLNVGKVACMVGYGMAKGRVYTKRNGNDAKLAGFSTLRMASAGWSMGTTLASEIIFFQDEDAFNRFSSGKFEIEGGAKVTVTSVSADCTAGTNGVSLFDRFITGKAKNDEKKRMYHNGMATFVIMKVGMMIDMSVVGQKFTFDAV